MNIKKIKLFIAKSSILRFYWRKKEQKENYQCQMNTTKEKIELVRDSKIGKRCFIIGNGPSLRIDDLNTLKEEDTFACNRIFRIFDKTTWRPTYYFCQDTRVEDEIIHDIENKYSDLNFILLNSHIYKKAKKIRNKKNVLFFYLNTTDNFPQKPSFSEDLAKQSFEGFTVTYTCIQMAVYMGYSEIYLIGIDHNYNAGFDANGNEIHESNTSNYMPGLEAVLQYPPQLQKSTLAYVAAREYCESHGITIKNATRGGKLEVFERINFDDIKF